MRHNNIFLLYSKFNYNKLITGTCDYNLFRVSILVVSPCRANSQIPGRLHL